MEPVRVHPENPHYFSWKGRPLVLVSSGDIYFDVFSPRQDWRGYLDQLAAWDCNFTRIYPAGCTAFVTADGRGSILPWPLLPHGLYDLDRWNPAFFERLHAFMAHAESRGIVVDVCLFNGFTTSWAQINNWCWPLLPFNAVNNLQHDGCTDMNEFTTLASASNVRRQKDYVRKICTELLPYGNVIYDTSDEPDCFGTIPAAKANPWVEEMLATLLDADGGQHLVAQTHVPVLEAAGGKDWCRDSRLAWTNAEYLRGLRDMGQQYAIGKPFVQIETLSPGESPAWNRWWSAMGLVYGGDVLSSSRIHAWAFLLAGGGGYLEWSAHYHPDASLGTEPQLSLLRQMRVLAGFLHELDVVRLRRFTGFSGPAREPSTEATTWASALAEEGRTYAFYVNRSRAVIRADDWYNGFFEPAPAAGTEVISFDAPAGAWHARWVEPADGSTRAAERLDHAGGRLELRSPVFAVDAALVVRRA